MSYAATLPETVDWLARTGREAFSALAKSYPDLFDYVTEDPWLGA
jgi:hypothetical protein